MVQLPLSLLRLARAPVLVTAVALVAGCALAPLPEHSEVLEQALPKGTTVPPSWKAEGSSGTVADDWLKALNDPQLDALVAEAIANNLDLRQAAERVTIAQQSVIVVGAQLLPQVGAALGGRTTNDEDHSTNSNVTQAYAGGGSSMRGEAPRPSLAAVEGYAATAPDSHARRQSPRRCRPGTSRPRRASSCTAEQAVEVYSHCSNW